jgi:hypothetical protein
MPALQIKSQFSEAQYQSFIESLFLDDFRPDVRFDIYFYSGSEENRRGYDIKIDSFIPIFLQVKRSHCYLQQSINKEMTIRRKSFKYNDDPAGYYFPIHIDRITNDYLQHNLLYNLNFTDRKYARYIAPIFIDRQFLMQLKYAQNPIHWNGIFTAELIYGQHLLHYWRDYFGIDHSILIQPHNILTHTKGVLHKYFFNRMKQISFHSNPIKIDSQGTSLNDLIKNLNEDINNPDSKKLMKLEEIFESVIKSIQATLNENKSEKNECSMYNKIIEEISADVKRQKISNFSDLTFNLINFHNLTFYIQERFDIRTYLIGKPFRYKYL